MPDITDTPNQISLTSVTSISKYSAKPAQTPAIFLCAMTRFSRLGGTAEYGGAAPLPAKPAAPGGVTACGRPAVKEAPHAVQKLAPSVFCAPHRVQYITIVSDASRHYPVRLDHKLLSVRKPA